MPFELHWRTELQECRARNELLEQKLHEVKGKLEDMETIKCNLDLQVTALSGSLGQAEATISALCDQMEVLGAEWQAARVEGRALEKGNRDLTTQCNAARTENCALHHQIKDLTAHKQEVDLRVCKIQVKNSLMSPSA